jgi:hypothetical protein
MTIEGQRNDDLALSLSKGGRGLQACFDKLSTGLQGWVSEGRFVCTPGQYLGSMPSGPLDLQPH